MFSEQNDRDPDGRDANTGEKSQVIMINGKPWDPTTELSSLMLAQDADPILRTDQAQHARDIFKEAAPMAARAICHLATFSRNERVRLDAAKYVVERNLGRVADDPTITGGDDMLMKFMKGFTTEAEDYANNGSPEGRY